MGATDDLLKLRNDIANFINRFPSYDPVAIQNGVTNFLNSRGYYTRVDLYAGVGLGATVLGVGFDVQGKLNDVDLELSASIHAGISSTNFTFSPSAKPFSVNVSAPLPTYVPFLNASIALNQYDSAKRDITSGAISFDVIASVDFNKTISPFDTNKQINTGSISGGVLYNLTLSFDKRDSYVDTVYKPAIASWLATQPWYVANPVSIQTIANDVINSKVDDLNYALVHVLNQRYGETVFERMPDLVIGTTIDQSLNPLTITVSKSPDGADTILTRSFTTRGTGELKQEHLQSVRLNSDGTKVVDPLTGRPIEYAISNLSDGVLGSPGVRNFVNDSLTFNGLRLGNARKPDGTLGSVNEAFDVLRNQATKYITSEPGTVNIGVFDVPGSGKSYFGAQEIKRTPTGYLIKQTNPNGVRASVSDPAAVSADTSSTAEIVVTPPTDSGKPRGKHAPGPTISEFILNGGSPLPPIAFEPIKVDTEALAAALQAAVDEAYDTDPDGNGILLAPGAADRLGIAQFGFDPVSGKFSWSTQNADGSITSTSFETDPVTGAPVKVERRLTNGLTRIDTGFDAAKGRFTIGSIYRKLESDLKEIVPSLDDLKNIPNNVQNLRVEDIAGEFGSQLGRQFTGNNQLTGAIASGTLKTVLGEVGKFVDKQVFNKESITAAKGFAEGTIQSKLGSPLAANIASAGIGSLSSYLSAELTKSIGLTGLAGEATSTLAGAYINAVITNLPGIVASSTSGVVIGQIITNITSGATGPAIFSGINPVSLATAVGGYFGSLLASQIVSFDTVGGQIGSAVGAAGGAILGFAVGQVLATLGAIGAGGLAGVFAQFGAFGGPVGALVGAFIGFLFGGLIGSIFGGTPRSGADVVWDAEKGQFGVANIWSKKSGSKDAAKGLASNVASTFNGVLSAVGGKLIDGHSVHAGNYGMRKKDFVYQALPDAADPQSVQNQKYITATFSGKDKDAASKLSNHGTYVGLADIIDRLAGGDIHVKRAVLATLNNAGGNRDSVQLGASGQFAIETLAGNIAAAQDYRRYLQDSTAINALIAAEPNSSFALGWLTTFALVKDLGLNKRASTDWIGGFNLWIDELTDGKIDGAALSPALFEAYLDVNSRARQCAVTDAAGAYLGSIGDTIEAADKDAILGTPGNDSITITNDTLIATAGLSINNAAPAAATYKIEVAALIDGGAGDDVIRGGDLGNDLLGGAGNDTLVGGKLDDWLIGGDGNDRLFAGNVSSVSFADSDSAAISAAITGGGAVSGGNGNLLDGGAGNDRLFGGAGSDWLLGGSGTDRLYGGAGGDILDGGADALDASGNTIIGTGDTLEGGGGSDQYLFGFGDGAATIFDDATQGATAGSSGDSLSQRIAGIESGALQRNWAGGGDYTLDGSVKGGEDAIAFKTGITFGNIVLDRSGDSTNPGQDLIIRLVTKTPDSNPANRKGYTSTLTGDELVIKDWFEGTRRIEWLRFANGDDIRIGDFISFKVGTAGADVIVGTNGADFLYGGDGDDMLFGLKGDDFGNGGFGNDLVSGDDDNDLVMGGEDNDKVLGGRGNDTVFGDEGDDDVYGGDGNDIVVGGQGNDLVTGGAGNDVFRYNRGDGRDTLQDELNGTWELVWKDGAYVNGYVLSGSTVTKAGITYFDGSNWTGRYNYDESQTGTFRGCAGAQCAANDDLELRSVA